MAGSDPQVAVRFGVKDAEVVRQALLNLGKDGEAALKRFDAAGKPASKSLSAVSDVVGEMKGRAGGFAGSLGLAGTALLGLGPIGLAVGAALGVAYYAINRATEGAKNLAQGAQELKSFASVTGLTLNQAAAVGKLGVEFGVGGDQVRAFVERFTAGMDEVRRAEGPLFEAINRIDPALARQLAGTRDAAEALDLLAQAYRKAGEQGDKFRQVQLARAAGGRGGAEVAQVLGLIAERGGLQRIASDAEAAGKGIDEALIGRLVKLKATIEETNKRAERIASSLFAEDVLEKELRFAQLMERAATAARDLHDAQKGMSWGDWFAEMMARGGDVDFGIVAKNRGLDEAGIARRGALSRLGQGLNDGKRSDLSNVYGAFFPGDAPDAQKNTRQSAEAQLNLYQRQMTVLADAATPAEQLKLKILQLAAAQEKSGVSSAVATRALGAFKDKQAETAVATREKLGLASEEEIRAVALKAVDRDYTNGYIKNAAERALADKLATKEAKERAEAVAVKASDFPQLTRLAQEGGDLRKQLDTELSGGLRGVTSDILAMAKGTETASQGFANMSQKMVDAIAQAVLMKTVIGPISGSLSSGLSSLFGGLGGGSPTGGLYPTASAAEVRMASGGVFERGLSRFTNSVVDRPTLFKFASGAGLMGEAGPEAIMPLRRDSSGRLGVNVAGGGSIGGDLHIHNNLGVEATARRERRPDGGLDVILDAIETRTADRAQRGRGAMSKLMPRAPLRG